MKSICVLAVLLLGLGAGLASADSLQPLVLTQQTLKPTIDNYPLVLVNFYAPWCRYSRELLPEFAKLVPLLQGEMVVANVDISEQESLGNEEHITHVPMVKFWKNGNLIATYNGQRKADNIVRWARSLTREVPELTTELVKQAEEQHKAVLVGFYKIDANPAVSVNSKGVDQHTVAFLQLHEALADVPVVFTTSNENQRQWAEDWGASGDKFPTLGLIYWQDSTPKSSRTVTGSAGTDSTTRVNIRMWNEETAFNPTNVKEWVSTCVSDAGCEAWRKSQPVLEQSDSTALRTVVGKNFDSVVFDASKDVLVYFGEEDLPAMSKTYASWLAEIARLTAESNSDAEEGNDHSTGHEAGVPVAVLSDASNRPIPASLVMLMEVADRLSTVNSVIVAHINLRKNAIPPKVRDQLPRLHAFAMFPMNSKDHFITYESNNETAEAILQFIVDTAFLPIDVPPKVDKTSPNSANEPGDVPSTPVGTVKHLFSCSWASYVNTIFSWLGLMWLQL